jgi:hypothetical protein
VQALAGGVHWLELVDGTALDSGERRQDGAWDDVCRAAVYRVGWIIPPPGDGEVISTEAFFVECLDVVTLSSLERDPRGLLVLLFPIPLTGGCPLSHPRDRRGALISHRAIAREPELTIVITSDPEVVGAGCLRR